jgi:hypothetical protein
MDLEALKIEFPQNFLKLQREEVISQLEKILSSEKTYSSESLLKPLTQMELNRRIDQSE